MTEPLTDKCHVCGKLITDEEYVVNWASCSECFGKHVDAYFASAGSMTPQPTLFDRPRRVPTKHTDTWSKRRVRELRRAYAFFVEEGDRA